MLPFDRGGAFNINKARLEHLDSLGLPLNEKTVLEVGAGVGRLTHFFETRECTVYSTEGRPENVKENLLRHPYRKGKVETVDLMVPHSHNHLVPFDVVFCYGTLYHLADPALCIKDLSIICDDLFLLETRVNQIDNGEVVSVVESGSSDQSLYYTGCKPARDWVMGELSKYFEYVYITNTQPNHPDYVLEWPATKKYVRSVFVASRSELDLSTLSTEIITSY
jgi:hypothetical protein